MGGGLSRPASYCYGRKLLERVGWERRASLESAIFEEMYDPGQNPSE